MPAFEVPAIARLLNPKAGVAGWHEHLDQGHAVVGLLGEVAPGARRVALDPATTFGRAELVRGAVPSCVAVSAAALVDACRMRESLAESALMERAFPLTVAVQAAAARTLRPRMAPREVARFVNAAYRALSATGDSTFCIVLFGLDTAFPHGVSEPKALEAGDPVLVDTGCRPYGNHSDHTRGYAFSGPSARRHRVWEDERAAQDAAITTSRTRAVVLVRGRRRQGTARAVATAGL